MRPAVFLWQMTESGYFSIRLHYFLLTLLGPMFTLLLGQRSDPINLGHKSLIKNTFSSSAWLFCATYILEIFFFFFFYTETKHQFVFMKNTKHTKKSRENTACENSCHKSNPLSFPCWQLVVCTCVVVDYSWLCFCAVLAMEQQKNLNYYQFLWKIRHKNWHTFFFLKVIFLRHTWFSQ